MDTLFFLTMPNGWQIVIIIALLLLFFGGKKIPELMRGLGKGINQFKAGLKEVEDDIKADISDDTPAKN